MWNRMLSQRVHIHYMIMELGSKRPSPLWFGDTNSIIGVYMDPLILRIYILGLHLQVRAPSSS